MSRWSELAATWQADLHRYGGRQGPAAFVRTWLTVPGFQFTAVMRAGRALASNGRGGRVLALLLQRRFERRWGISIPFETDIGPGLYIGHFGGIVVNPRARIGRNCNIQQGVTIGQANRGRREGTPVIGDGVWIGPGAKVVGAVTIGDNVLIGANCVVTDDVPSNAVVAAGAAQVVSASGGAAGYVQHPVR